MSGTSSHTDHTPWAAALEGLAEKRQAITDAIVSLSRVAGVDPAPYLGTGILVEGSGGRPANTAPLSERLRDAAKKMREPEAPTPPRPQMPVSRTTAGAGHEDKVLNALSAGPLQPKAIAQKTGIHKKTLERVLREMRSSNLVTKTGKTAGTVYQLTT